MPIKNQTSCYRTIKGERWPNACDMLDDQHDADIARAKAAGLRVKVIKHPDGFSRAFMHPADLESFSNILGGGEK